MRLLLLLLAHVSCASPHTHKYVRRELRQLSEQERNATFDAIWAMKRLSATEGVQRYGPAFRTYDHFVVKHGHAALDSRCDQGHFGPAFGVFHRAFGLEFERSLQAINPTLALPYWDYLLDLPSPENSLLWTDGWFGALSGHPDDGYQIRDGYFANWPIKQNASSISDFSSPYGYLRAPFDNNPSPTLTRCHTLCGPAGNSTLFRGSNWNQCLEEPQYEDWRQCIDTIGDPQNRGVHAIGHIWLGGIFNSEDPSCFRNWAPVGPTLEPGELWRADYVRGCYQCPRNCTIGLTEPHECVCWHTNASACHYLADPAQIGSAGDFLSGVSSPNDPLFFFYHAQVDRHLMAWQMLHSAVSKEGDHYGYPVEGYCFGHNLHDVISSRDPFTHLFDGPHTHPGPYTAADLLDLARVPYTYDSL